MSNPGAQNSVARRTRSFYTGIGVRLPPVGAILLGALLLWFSIPTLLSLHPVWLSYNYSHAYLVVALTGYLIFLELRHERVEPLRPSLAGLILLAVCVAATIAFRVSTTLLLAQMTLPVLWLSAIWAFAGASTARRFVLPLGYLYFVIPFWDFTIPPLQDLTVRVVSAWIRTAHVPAFIEGNLIHVPSGNFEVMEGCAGLHYLIVAMALAAFYGQLNHRRWVPTAVLTIVALALALVGNWLRVFIIVVTGYVSEMQHPLVTSDHIFFGWVMFLIFMVPLIFVDRLFAAPDEARAPASGVAVGREGIVTGLRLGVPYVACAVLLLGLGLDALARAPAVGPTTVATVVSPEIPAWERVSDWDDGRRPRFVGATAEASAWYEDGAARVGAYVAQYAVQTQNREVVFAENRPAGESAIISASRPIAVTVASGAGIPFRELEVADADSARRLVWVGLRVAGRPVPGGIAAKLAQISGAVRGRWDAQALVLSAACGNDCGAARASLSQFAIAAAGSLYRQAEQSRRAVDASSGVKVEKTL